MRSHRPGRGNRVPISTYRIQLTPDFTFDDLARQVPYLARLGITDLYLSPILESGQGSVHGYDVTSHAQVSAEKGGRAGFEHLAASAREHGIHLIADVVPNHMTVPTPLSRNAQFWSVLREGEHSPHAHWFDVDWHTQDHHLMLPVLGAPLAAVLARGELTRGRGGPGGDEEVLRYFEHEFPLRPGTEHLPLPEVLDAQPYRLAHWREGEDGLNYRRFFDVTTLAGIRVEEPDVFYRTHALLLDLLDTGRLSGLRIDHPDGLADPGGYLARLARATGDVWVVAEKILEGNEELPSDWACAGTTGYDALARVTGLFTDADGATSLTDTYAAFTAERRPLTDIIDQAKTDVVQGVLEAEIGRLVRLLGWLVPSAQEASLRRVVAALLVAMDRYRIYVPRLETATVDATELMHACAERAASALAEDDQGLLAAVVALALGEPTSDIRPDQEAAIADFVTRFQQTCGPVMAKGIEDTASYRFQRLVAANEVGGKAGRIGLSAKEFHEYCGERQRTWPVTLTGLSTHDTKRSEDARARGLAMSAHADAWREWVTLATELASPHRSPLVDASTEYRLWQEFVSVWPISGSRATAYAQKAVKEAKQHTTWTSPDAAYEQAVETLALGLVTDPAVAAHVETWLTEIAATERVIVLGQKLVQLTMPGVADTYQGCEVLDRSLVDPDNRRPVDYELRSQSLTRLDDGAAPVDLSAEKLLVTSTALRLRRDHPEWFVGSGATYLPLPCPDESAVAFARGDDRGPGVVVVAARPAGSSSVADSPNAAVVDLPTGPWIDLLGTATHAGGPTQLADLLATRPVALLRRS